MRFELCANAEFAASDARVTIKISDKKQDEESRQLVMVMETAAPGQKSDAVS
jgi:hypothetical protein